MLRNSIVGASRRGAAKWLRLMVSLNSKAEWETREGGECKGVETAEVISD